MPLRESLGQNHRSGFFRLLVHSSGVGYLPPTIEDGAGLTAWRLPVNNHVFFTRTFRESLIRFFLAMTHRAAMSHLRVLLNPQEGWHAQSIGNHTGARGQSYVGERSGRQAEKASAKTDAQKPPGH